MIKNKELLSMTESAKYLHKDIETEAEALQFIKKFVKIDPKKAEEMRKEIEGLEMIKMRAEHVAKIIDIMPDNQENVNKIFNDVSLDEDETNKIIETVKKFE